MSLAADYANYYKVLRSDAANFFNSAQEIVDYMMPSHRGITDQNAPGDRKTHKIYDSTAPDAIFLLTSFLQGSIFSESSQWFNIKHRIEEINEMAEVAQFLQESRDRMLLAFRQSNFYAATMEWLMDWIAFGNACIIQERVQQRRKHEDNLVFTAVGYGSYVFFEGRDKRPEGLIREVDMSAKQIVEKVGIENVTGAIKTAFEKTPFKNFQILHAIVPRKDITKKSLATAKEMDYASLWIEPRENKMLMESGYPEKPFAIARYNLIAGEVMGRGLGEIALPHVKTINGAELRGFLEWDKTIDPPIDSQQGNIVGAYSHTAGALNILKRLDATRVNSAAMEMRGRNATHEWNLEDKRRQVRDTFFVSQIRELIGLTGGAVREQTATEAMMKLRLLHTIMAPTGGRLQSEGMRDIIDTNFALLYRMQMLPQVPQVLINAAEKVKGGAQLDITYEGPLAKAQREEELQSIKEYMGDVLQMAQSHPEVLDVPDADMIVRRDAEIRGVHFLNNDPDTTGIIRKQKAQIQQLQAQLNAAQQMSEIAKNAAPMVTAMQNGQQNGAQAA